MSEYSSKPHIAVIGVGTIGLSFVALHLTHTAHPIKVFDKRPDVDAQISQKLPSYLSESFSDFSRVSIARSLGDAVSEAFIIQECLTENQDLKIQTWTEIEAHCSKDALLWSATSGIPSSIQASQMKDKSRLLVVHPYNPPHIMPLLEIVPSPSTSQSVIDSTLAYWKGSGRTPVVIKEECTGFVANRLAFALFREAIHLVNNGVVSVQEVDRIVEHSMGPRWTVAGPFKSYHAGGGEGELTAFMKNVGPTVGKCWEEQGEVLVGGGWEDTVCRQTAEAYGVVDTARRDRITRKILQVIEEETNSSSG